MKRFIFGCLVGTSITLAGLKLMEPENHLDRGNR